MPKSHTPYPPEFRQRMIELVRSGRSPDELAEKFEPTAQSIRNWVAQADRDRVLREVIDSLLAWKLPGGDAVVARAAPREEVYAGPLADRAPDVVVELGLDAGYGLSLVPTRWSDASRSAVRVLEGEALAGGRGSGMNGTHRPDGVLLAAGPGSEALAGVRALSQLAPACLRAMGVAWADGDAVTGRPAPYTDEEAAEVAARLRALGYLE